MTFSAQGAHVLVTGASRGIGYAVAAEFARRGALVTAVARNEQQLDVLADAQFYSSDTTIIRIGLLFINIAMCFFAPMIALTTDLMLRIPSAPKVLAYLQAIAGAAVVIFASAGPMFMNIAAFRPERAPEITQALNDVGWILFIAPITVFLLQQFPIAVAVFMDASERPVFPRWVGYLNIWVPISFLPAFLVYFAKSGPVPWQPPRPLGLG